MTVTSLIFAKQLHTLVYSVSNKKQEKDKSRSTEENSRGLD
jgi:hypothetical protein